MEGGVAEPRVAAAAGQRGGTEGKTMEGGRKSVFFPKKLGKSTIFRGSLRFQPHVAND
jgi:hypothetical protein